jgi:hypothetical protein
MQTITKLKRTDSELSKNNNSIDILIDKKEFDIHTEDCLCIIDEVEFVKIIDLTTQTPLPVVETTQPTATLLPRKGVSKFFSRVWNRFTVLPLTMPLCLVLVLGLNGVQAQIYSNTFTGVSACPTNGNTPTMATNSTGSALSRSTITCNATANVFNSTTLNNTSSISNTSYIEFSATANSGYILNITSVSFLRQGSNTAPNQMEVRYSTDGFSTSTTWGSAPVTPTSGTTATWDFADFSTGNGGSVTFRIYPYGTTRCDLAVGAASSTGTFRVDNVTINGSVSAAAPTITGATTATAFSTTYGTASAVQSFSISGSNLTANLVATAPTGFEVSSDGTTYGSTATFTQSGGSASGTLRIRLKADAAVTGTYNSQNIVLSSTGATNVNIATASSGNAVSAKDLTITGLSASDKNFDGATTVSISGTATYSGLVNSESFSPSDVVTWAFPDANVGSNKTLTRTGSYSAPSTNYTVTQPSLTASINAIVPTVPTITGITPGNNQLSVAFTAPSSNGGASISNYEYSTNGGTGWTTPSLAVTSSPLLITGLTNGVTYDVQIRAVNSVGSGAATATTQGTPAAPSSPTITGATTATAFTTTYGTASVAQSFSVSGSALTANITATAPTGFEVSSDNSTYGSTATFTQSGGSASGTLYVRLAATATVSGSYNSQNIALTSAGASTVNITTAASGNTVTAKGLTITGISISNKTYDGSTSATISGTAAYSGLVNGESFSVSGTPSSTFSNKNVGNGKSVSVSGYTAPSANYSITQPIGLTANITAKTLTVTSAAVISKTYDETNTANITGSLSGVVSGDAVTLNGTGTFASVNVGSGINVTSTSSLSGADAGNYTLTQPTGLTGDITQASQTITFASLTPATLSTADYSPSATASSGLTVSYSSSNTCVATIVGGNIHIVGSGTTTITASQSGGGNYSAASSVNQTLVVMNPTSTLSAGDVVVIAYNTSGSPDNFALLFNTDVSAGTVFYVNDNELASSSSTSFTDLGEMEASFTVKAGQTITAGTVIVLPWGTTAVSTAQYDWSSTSGAGLGANNDEIYIYTANSISATTPSAFLSFTKIGTSPSSIPSTLTSGTTAISPSGNSLRYITSGATYSGTKATLLTAIGNTATNWNTTGATTFAPGDWTFSVSPLPTISSTGTLSAVNTTYGTASASPTSFSLSANNLSTDLTVTAPSGFEISSGSGYNTTITISPDGCGSIASTTIYVRLAATTGVGSYSGNILLSSTGATSVNVATVSSIVSAKSLTITGLSAADKTYDGITTVSVSGTPSYSGLVNGESFSVSGTVTWAFPNATVENNKTLTRTGNFNAPSANYMVSQPSLTASITTRSLSITANNVNKPFGVTITGGSGSTAFTSSGLQNGETIGTITIAYGNGAGASDAVGTYSGQVTPSAATGGTFTASNYSISYVAGDIIVSDVPTLDAVTLTNILTSTYGTASTGVSFIASGSSLSENITATAQSGYEVSSDNSIFSSSVSISSGSTVYVRFSATLAAGSYNNATSVVLTSTGATSTNVTTSSSGNTVSVKGLTITGISISNKTYDGNTTATISGTATYSGLVNGEFFSVTGTPSASFADKTVANGKSVTVSGYTAPSANYSITQPTGLTANITSKELTVTSAAVTTKTYDGTTSATITGTLAGVIFGDIVSLVGTGTFASANVGTGINVTSTSTLSGADAGNYTLTQPTGLTGEITKANQTITFGALANKTTADVPFNLTATASSGLTVSYTSSNTAVASIVGNTVTIVGVGTTNITASQPGNSNYNAAADVVQPLTVTLPDVEEIIFPQYAINGSTTASRLQYVCRLRINNLTANATYRYTTQGSLSGSTAGNMFVINNSTDASGYITGYTSSKSLNGSLIGSNEFATTARYGEFTTNSNGSYEGWFSIVPTSNAIFTAGNSINFGIVLNNGSGGTVAVKTVNTTSTISIINPASGSNGGQAIKGTANCANEQMVFIYDNSTGTGRPISGTWTENDGITTTMTTWYESGVTGAGAWGTYIPVSLSNGIKRIEFKKTSDNSLIYAVTDNDGNWNGTANTVNPTGGTTAFSIPNTTFDDAYVSETNGVTLTQNTVINGTLTLNSGTLTVGANTLTLNGAISRTSGNIDASNASATLVFGGSTEQTIPASTFTGNINNLTLSNSAGLTTNQSLTVANTLSLSSGIFTLGTNNLTLTGSLHVSNNGSSTSFINTNSTGAFIRSISTTGVDYKFPVGLSDYAPITVNFTGGTIASSTLASRAVSGLHPEAADGAYIRSNLYWEMNQTGMTNPQYNVSFTYPGVVIGSGSTESEEDLLPAKYSPSTGWLSSGSCAVCFSGTTVGTSSVNTSTKTITWNGVSGFSDFGGFGQGNGSPLPVELLSFSASCVENQTVISWQTASEQSASHFDIEKSTDGMNWRVIGQVQAAGNSTELLSYQFVDSEKNNATAYYRLNQVDFDGKNEYFGPVALTCEQNSFEASTLPNPSSEDFWLRVHTENNESVSLKIKDINGAVIHGEELTIMKGMNMFPIRKHLTPGIYLIDVKTNKGNHNVIKHLRY